MRRLFVIGLVLLVGCGPKEAGGAAVPLDQLPAGFLDKARKELPQVEVKWTAPSEVYRKRINALFGAP